MNPIKKMLEAGGPTLGSWYGIRCGLTAERYGAVGFDWVIVDLQHGSTTWDGLLATLQALQLGGTAALVRVTGHDVAEIGRALDIGAVGVVVPMVSTPEEAARLAAATRFAPHGTRSLGQLRKTLGADTLAHDPFCVLMIETVEGMSNLDAIVATPGVDCVLLGGVDLAASMGLSPREIFASPPPPAICDAMDRLVAACDRYGKVAGNAALDADEVLPLVEVGMRFIPLGAAAMFLSTAAQNALADARARIDGMTADPKTT